MSKVLLKAKNILGSKQLQRDLSHRNARKTEYIAVGDAKTIAVISDLSNDYTFNNIINFLNKFSAEGKTVTTLYCCADKAIPSFYNQEPTLIDKSKLNFALIPERSEIQKFIDTEYDFLFDFSDNNLFTVEYIFALSMARLKVSKSSLKTSKYADVCLALQNKNEIKDYLTAIDNYLNISTIK